MQAAEIKDRDSFEAWLNAWPADSRRETAVALAHRTALRVAPILERKGKLTHSQHATLVRDALWANAITRVAATYPTRDIEAAAAAAFDVQAVGAAAAATFAVATAYAAFPAATAFGSAAARSAARAAGRAAAAFWVELRDDASKLQNGESHLSLLRSRLWASDPELWRLEYFRFSRLLQSKPMRADGWSIWDQWYAALYTGKPIFGIQSPTLRQTLERNIALGSTDGTFNKDFWTREPKLINADITKWVEEAQLADRLSRAQDIGLRFRLRRGLVAFFPLVGLSERENNLARIKSQLPILNEIVVSFERRLKSLVTDDDALLAAISGLKSAVTCAPENIDPDALFARCAILRGQIEEADKAGTSGGGNYFKLAGGDLATAKSITLTSDMIVLATERGKELFDDADRLEFDAGTIGKLREIELQLLDLLAEEGELMEPEAAALLRQLFAIQPVSPHPKRVFHAASVSLRNAALVSIALPLAITGAIEASPLLLMVLAGYWATEEFAKETPLGDVLKDVRIEKIRKLESAVLANEKLIKQLVKQYPSWKPVGDMFDLLKSKHNKSNANSSS